MLMLMQVLGGKFVVWDKSASIRFRRPGRSTLYMRYELTDELLESVRQEVAQNGQAERTFTLQWVDAAGIVHAEIERLCYVADKAHYEQKKGSGTASRTQSSRFQRKTND